MWIDVDECERELRTHVDQCGSMRTHVSANCGSMWIHIDSHWPAADACGRMRVA